MKLRRRFAWLARGEWVRLFAVLTTALLLGQAVAVFAAPRAGECADGCPAAWPCQFCACCSHPGAMTPQPTVAMPAAPPIRAALTPAKRFLPLPQPREIFHVPELLAQSQL